MLMHIFFVVENLRGGMGERAVCRRRWVEREEQVVLGWEAGGGVGNGM
jgi:hypothetical protein